MPFRVCWLNGFDLGKGARWFMSRVGFGMYLVSALACSGKNPSEARTPRVTLALSRTEIQVGDSVDLRVTFDDSVITDFSITVSPLSIAVENGVKSAVGTGVGEAEVRLAIGTSAVTLPGGSGSIKLSVIAPPASNRPAFSALDAGASHSCALANDGAAFCWGDATGGRLGARGYRCADFREHAPTWTCSSVPVRVTGIPPLTSIDAGATATCGLAVGGDAYCWGGNPYYFGTNPPRLVSAGLRFTSVSVQSLGDDNLACGLTQAGPVYCWGTGSGSSDPLPVTAPAALASVSVGGDYGRYRACALDGQGRALCWGWGVLGDGSAARMSEEKTPTPVAGDLRFSSISVGAGHVCAISADSLAYCWGANSPASPTGTAQPQSGSVSDFVLAPSKVSTALRFTAISAGAFRTCAVAIDQSAYCWGDHYGQVPALVPGGHHFATISAGLDAVCGMTVEGESLCWGSNAYGSLGNARLGEPYLYEPVTQAGQRLAALP
jgi:alpha-tubulin suppressor-like RCC1 family protein